MITVAYPAALTAEGSAESRTIRGVAVPWNVDGQVSDGARVRFLPGALDAAARPVTLRDHDRSRAVGRVIAAADTGDAIGVASRIARTPIGDETLVLAEAGVLMFSVGVNPTTFHYDGDTLVVETAEWQELSLLPIGAFAGAVVTDVAAAAPTERNPMTDTLNADPAAPDPAPVVVAAAPVAALPVVAAAAPTPERPAVVPLVTAGRAAGADLTLAGLAQLWASQTRGEITTDHLRSRIQAALTDVTLVGTTNVGGFARPAFSSEIVGLVDQGRPLIDALSSAPLPASGMAIEFPRWTAEPQVGIQAAEKTQVTSVPVGMAVGSAPVLTWAGANDISLQAVERSSPSFLEAYLRAAAIDFAKKTDTYVGTTLLAAAATVPPGTSFVDNIAALIGSINPAASPGGSIFVAVAQDVAVSMIGITGLDGPALWSASISFGSTPTTATAGGLNIFVDPWLPAKTYLLGFRQGATWHQNPGAPADIRVVDVSLLGLDVGVYGFGALTVEWPGAFKKLTTT